MKFLVAMACVALAMGSSLQEVEMLAEEEGGQPTLLNGGDQEMPPSMNGGQSTGYQNNDGAEFAANFPGPKYGLPGYKESHTWESGRIRSPISPLLSLNAE